MVEDRTELQRELLRMALRNGFAPAPNQSDAARRQANALEFIAYALGELVSEVRLLREANSGQRPTK